MFLCPAGIRHGFLREEGIVELHPDLNKWMKYYNKYYPHSGCYGKTPMQTFKESMQLAKQKMLDQLVQTEA